MFDSAGVRVGEGGGAAADARIDDGALVIEFPRSPARVEIAGGMHLADPTIVCVHRGGPSRVDGAPWFALSADALGGIMSAHAFERFAACRALPVEASAYLAQLVLLESLRAHGAVDPKAIVRTVRAIAAGIVGASVDPDRDRPRPFSPRQRDLATRAKMLVASRARARLSVRAIAARLGCSVFYLCHTFRDVERTTIGAYHTQIRVRAGARRLLEAPSVDLSDLALELGFSSHSHFTAAFRKSFGLTPSALMHASKRIAC
ncbi:MAG: AraC family transcriptional regulator [Acidobacteriota bacterium]|nr:AraC family transcriptional regulator [Acidobacteriota bacterium]